MTQVLIDGEGDLTFLFAHGAGAGMEHEFMEQVAKGLSSLGIRVVRFNFPYMVKRSEDGKKRPPDRAPKLLEAYQTILEDQANGKPVVIGGKSMGGRMASLMSESELVSGIACLGFPFHPPGKPENYKGDHLATIAKSTLILQGERDTFGKKEECADFAFSKNVALTFIPDGDHSFKPRKSSGHTQDSNIELAVSHLERFIRSCYEK
ncbi:putative Alpha/beta hydrolase [Vibrio nigripulchritudo SFn27]|uniref:Putative Alpha/beta hydrolase n=1 Tax=Vibrio nigripulchritudo TaxID=28173 RepID=U4JVH6_9VIBR|nr:alpha/beta family hydrolase [Vibrio nigripulchritudo]CCN81829.1 putative Alpha/beta hydrolase [Vibrio nigripulchritudo BLFn1]CCN88297.1 putative Alpha/beta hydrolase [Vibrio nigripulchritudo SFn27]CCN95287.1 putative Alpha/beta hydrolase [Vibrio nigripulchritudo ENn2]CCO41284.1 putative Alpha/beta hydrolase [Vibrio nigripulchritudo SFn135]CCO53983.1 putative Alpha/beta hydrolase [Vibrio nigripulchritudo Wn13]